MKTTGDQTTMKCKKVSLEMVAIAAIAFGAEQIREGNMKVGIASSGVGLVAVVAYEALQEKQIAGFTAEDVSDAASTIGEYFEDGGGGQ